MNDPPLTRDALSIWHAGLAGVNSQELIRQTVRVDQDRLWLADHSVRLPSVERLVVVGAGKAGAGMAAGLESTLGPGLMQQKQLRGWVNVPSDCVQPLQRITLHAARPAGVNEPTEEGVYGAQRILEIVRSLGPRDLCICLLSGGGSALLPAPSRHLTLADKLAVTQFLSAAGANIEQLNTVRKQLSDIKGGGLARACRAGQLVTLIISDVIGDPLDIIASGPTVPNTTTAGDALQLLDHFDARGAGIGQNVFDHLRNRVSQPQQAGEFDTSRVTNIVIGNNAVAVDAAGIKAESLGYAHAMVTQVSSEEKAESVGRHLAGMAIQMKSNPGPNCLISGGEPTVTLVDSSIRGMGGRNQQLVLAALCELLKSGPSLQEIMQDLVILSGGTDGEDGPTDAAGALIDTQVALALENSSLDPADFLRRNDAYHFFEPWGGLIKTGPTHTNVCDLRIVLRRK